MLFRSGLPLTPTARQRPYGCHLEELADACASLVPGFLAAVADGRIRPVVNLVLGLEDAKRRRITRGQQAVGKIAVPMP
jgi:NADPH:quinone reductase-like Zn-dependent oxidoreductase